MIMINWRVLYLVFMLPAVLLGQEKITNEQYIEMYYPIAVRKMIEYRIPASITLAQGILESSCGNSNLAKKANNHFGIKCHADWTGDGFYMDDDAANECFRVYNTPEESFADHSQFLTTRARYKFLFEDYAVNDYKGWAAGLKQAGYATNPQYPQLLIGIIERYNLQQYDAMGLKDIQETPLVAEPVYEEELAEEVYTPFLPKGAYYVDNKQDVFIYNGAKAVKSKGRQALEIATQYHIDYNKLKEMNDIHEGYLFTDNQIVYLEPKSTKGTRIKHTVRNGESMWEISQEFGIKLDKLYKRNRMVFDKQAKPGEEVYLQGKRKKSSGYYELYGCFRRKK
ncbi:MAG: glucosaminidase domain-containing protein [Chitinophagales bacterium]|nr:glucosaminidase domain-containing protein [Chitinophagales bacterium]